MCKDIFNESPTTSIKQLFKDERSKLNDDRGFFNICATYLGGRSYNKFLDYSLFAIKLNRIWAKHCWLEKGSDWTEMWAAIMNLLTDDRHDMYQNVPYELDAAVKDMSDEKKVAFWGDVATTLIECINVNGTGDVSFRFRIDEE
jgi:hypothetical protein